jgi:hypothetical protein
MSSTAWQPEDPARRPVSIFSLGRLNDPVPYFLLNLNCLPVKVFNLELEHFSGAQPCCGESYRSHLHLSTASLTIALIWSAENTGVCRRRLLICGISMKS